MMIQAVVFAMAAAAQTVPSGAPSSIARDYFMDARRAYRTAAYAEGTNSVIRRYSREDPFGVDAKYDQPDLTRRLVISGKDAKLTMKNTKNVVIEDSKLPEIDKVNSTRIRVDGEIL